MRPCEVFVFESSESIDEFGSSVRDVCETFPIRTFSCTSTLPAISLSVHSIEDRKVVFPTQFAPTSHIFTSLCISSSCGQENSGSLYHISQPESVTSVCGSFPTVAICTSCDFCAAGASTISILSSIFTRLCT